MTEISLAAAGVVGSVALRSHDFEERPQYISQGTVTVCHYKVSRGFSEVFDDNQMNPCAATAVFLKSRRISSLHSDESIEDLGLMR